MTTRKTIEHPILFSGQMVRAILDGKKSQTRRVVKPQPVCNIPGAYFDKYNGGPQWNWWTKDNKVCNGHNIFTCPYGKPGDQLWVRETWTPTQVCNSRGINIWADSGPVYYKADPKDFQRNFSWKPSIHMPRWASRITLEITDIRVERVQNISEDDAKKEGVNFGVVKCPSGEMTLYARCEFFSLWESINNKRGFGIGVNPYVWVIEFKRIKP